MNKAISYAAILILLVGAVFFHFRREIPNSENMLPENALVKAEDVSGTDFYVRYQETSGTDFYDLPVSEKYVSTKAINLVGDYNKDEDKGIFLSSIITKYVNGAEPYFELYQAVISNHTRDWHNEEEFTPNFTGSSYFQYRECIKGIKADSTEAYMCIVSITVKQNYLFILHLRGSGTITNEGLENIIENALVHKQDILEGLP